MPTILLSSRTAAALAPAIAGVMDGREHRLLIADDTAPGAQVDIAFLTREITGRSTKRNILPNTQHYYDLLTGSPSLRWLQIHSAGADKAIYGELRARGVDVTTASGANAGPVAHSVMAGLLSLARNFPTFQAAQREKRWDQRMDKAPPRDLRKQTAVIVGWGPVGQEVARLLRAIGVECIAVRRCVDSASRTTETGVRFITFAELPAQLPNADWLILACPMTDLTRALVNRDSLALLPAGARVINVARGEVVVHTDLIDALRSGHLAGAYLDVTDPEPLPADSPLWTLENVIITPHTAGHADTNEERVAEIFLKNLERWRDGLPLTNLVT